MKVLNVIKSVGATAVGVITKHPVISTIAGVVAIGIVGTIVYKRHTKKKVDKYIDELINTLDSEIDYNEFEEETDGEVNEEEAPSVEEVINSCTMEEMKESMEDAIAALKAILDEHKITGYEKIINKCRKDVNDAISKNDENKARLAIISFTTKMQNLIKSQANKISK